MAHNSHLDIQCCQAPCRSGIMKVPIMLPTAAAAMIDMHEQLAPDFNLSFCKCRQRCRRNTSSAAMQCCFWHQFFHEAFLRMVYTKNPRTLTADCSSYIAQVPATKASIMIVDTDRSSTSSFSAGDQRRAIVPGVCHSEGCFFVWRHCPQLLQQQQS